jgi:diguanylate cyclase (GGDEF)-like protein/PAS domain S-box-containing protein
LRTDNQAKSDGAVTNQIPEEIGDDRLLSAILDTTEAIMAITDPKGSLIRVNQAFRDVFGYSDRECLGRPIWAFRAVADAAEGRSSFRHRKVDASGTFKTDKEIWRAADGSELLLRWSIQIIRNDGGKDVARVGTAQNLTEIRAAEEKHRILEYVADNLSEPLFFINPDGTIRYASRAVERVYGYTPEQLIGQPSSILRPADKTAKMADYIARLQESGKPEMLETEAVHIDGSQIPIELRTAPVFDSKGTYVGLSSVVYDMKDRLELEQELRRLAGTDPLTGLANRLGFKTAADREVKRAKRYKHPLAVFVTDLDHFKKVNDTYGHAAGDAALVRFADMLGWSLRRPIDHVARTGGEEFVAILPETDPRGGLCAAERVRASTEANPITYEDASFHLTASFGVSVWQPDEEDLGDAIQRADEALYEAKNTGRNRVVFREAVAGDQERLAG